MSLHAQISPEAQALLDAQHRNSTISSIAISLLLLVVIGLILAYIFLTPFSRETTTIIAYTAPIGEEDKVEQKKMINSVERKPSAPSSSMAKVIAANTSSPTAIPVPDFDMPEPSTDFGDGDDFGDGWGSGGDGGGGSGGGTGTTAFGSKSGPGLTGTFYDLKQTASGKPSDMKLQPFEANGDFVISAPVNKEYDKELGRAIRRNLSEQAFGKFYQAPRKLRLTQLYISQIGAEEAPESFEIGGTVKGRRWAIAYRGRVTPSVSGRFRFVGFADDVLVVLANNREVLDGSLASPIDDSNSRKGFQQQHTNNGWKTFEGKWLSVTAGKPIDLTILTGERPGGHYLGYLLIEKQGEDYQTDGKGARKLPLFKLAPSPMPERGQNVPDLAPDTPWSVWSTSN